MIKYKIKEIDKMLKFKYDMLKGNGSKFYKELGFDPQ